MNDYYYGEQIDNFTFYRVPKALFTIPRYKTLSAEAKILYGLLLDRAALSTRNGWKDEQGRIFIYYTVKKITREKSISCTQECSSLSFCFSFLSQDWFLNRFPRTALKTERYFCCSEARQAIQ